MRTLLFMGYSSCYLLRCTAVETSAGKAFGNANSVVRSSSDKMWDRADEPSTADEQQKEKSRGPQGDRY